MVCMANGLLDLQDGAVHLNAFLFAVKLERDLVTKQQRVDAARGGQLLKFRPTQRVDIVRHHAKFADAHA